MATLNEVKYKTLYALLGSPASPNSLNELEYDWLGLKGNTARTLNERWMQEFNRNGFYGDWNGAACKYLQSFGLTGTINEMWYQFWFGYIELNNLLTTPNNLTGADWDNLNSTLLFTGLNTWVIQNNVIGTPSAIAQEYSPVSVGNLFHFSVELQNKSVANPPNIYTLVLSSVDGSVDLERSVIDLTDAQIPVGSMEWQKFEIFHTVTNPLADKVRVSLEMVSGTDNMAISWRYPILLLINGAPLEHVTYEGIDVTHNGADVTHTQ